MVHHPMTKKAVSAGFLMALAVSAAACSGNKAEIVNPNIYPTQYRQEIAATLQRVLTDPTHLSGALLSEPALGPVDKDQRYIACLRFSERNPDTRQYDPPQTRVAYFFGGHLNQLVMAKEDQCATAAYKPFPEAEKLCPDKSDCK